MQEGILSIIFCYCSVFRSPLHLLFCILHPSRKKNAIAIGQSRKENTILNSSFLRGIIMENPRSARIRLLASMFIFGTISIVVRGAGLPSAVLALGRAVIGSIALILFSIIKGNRPDFAAIRKNLKWLIPSGTMLGLNWILLFESYNYASVATATLCYYMAPVFLVLVSPAIFKETLTVKKINCILIALLGMVLVSGITESGLKQTELKGILLGLGAAVLYASILVCNKCMGKVPSFDRVITQLIISIPAMIIYILLTGQLKGLTFTGSSVVWLLVAGIVHTGFAYVLLYGSLPQVSSHTAAILSYLDPMIAVIVSVLFLKEPLTVPAAVGAVLILGAAVVSEITPSRK